MKILNAPVKEEAHISYMYYSFNPKEKSILFFAATGASLLVGYLFFNSFIFAFCGIPVTIFMQKPAQQFFIERRTRRIKKELKDLLYSFSASFSGGRDMFAAMRDSVPYLYGIYGKDCLLAKEMEEGLYLIENGRFSLSGFWEDLAARTGIEDLEDFSSVFSACVETGGNLIDAVNRAADIIGEKMLIENDMRALAVQKKVEGRMIGLLPPLIIFFLRLTSPSYLLVLYTTVGGRLVMGFTLLATVYAFFLMEKLTRIDI